MDSQLSAQKKIKIKINQILILIQITQIIKITKNKNCLQMELTLLNTLFKTSIIEICKFEASQCVDLFKRLQKQEQKQRSSQIFTEKVRKLKISIKKGLKNK